MTPLVSPEEPTNMTPNDRMILAEAVIFLRSLHEYDQFHSTVATQGEMADAIQRALVALTPHCHSCKLSHEPDAPWHTEHICSCGATKPNVLGSDRWTEAALDEATVRSLMVDALRLARHTLATTHGLVVTDQPNAFEDAQRDGCDANAARDVQREVSWEIDHASELRVVDAVLTLVAPSSPRSSEDPPQPTKSLPNVSPLAAIADRADPNCLRCGGYGFPLPPPSDTLCDCVREDPPQPQDEE